MRALIRRRGRGAAHDPAPSRAAYRLTRLWLSPAVRWFVLVILPLAVIGGTGAYWVVQPAQQARLALWTGELRASVEARPEFQIKQMAITGASPELADAVRARVALEFPVSWFDVDARAIHAAVAELDAVADVEVTVQLRSALQLRITERDPAILWRSHDGLRMLDAGGHPIAHIDRRDGRPDLPLITGEGADRAVPEALALAATAAPLGDRFVALTRQGERRWDVVLDRGQVIRLPENNARAGFERVLAMHGAMDVLNRDVAVIDMRDAKRPTVRLGPAAVDYLRVTRAFEQGLASQ